MIKTKNINTGARVLLLDIETRPTVAYVWRLFDENIGTDQIIDAGGTICVGAKWLGEKQMTFVSDWTNGHREMLEIIHAMIEEADAVITYNGDRFDLPKLMGEFLINGMKPPATPTSIDVYKAMKKLGLPSNKLAFVGPFLGVGRKVKHEGFNLWKDVLAGDLKARAKMEKYCVQDVVLLENVYLKILPFIRNHPHMGKTKSQACGACGSVHVQSRGVRRTKAFRIQRLHCQNCGSWSDGRREKNG